MVSWLKLVDASLRGKATPVPHLMDNIILHVDLEFLHMHRARKGANGSENMLRDAPPNAGISSSPVLRRSKLLDVGNNSEKSGKRVLSSQEIRSKLKSRRRGMLQS